MIGGSVGPVVPVVPLAPPLPPAVVALVLSAVEVVVVAPPIPVVALELELVTALAALSVAVVLELLPVVVLEVLAVVVLEALEVLPVVALEALPVVALEAVADSLAVSASVPIAVAPPGSCPSPQATSVAAVSSHRTSTERLRSVATTSTTPPRGRSGEGWKITRVLAIGCLEQKPGRRCQARVCAPKEIGGS